MDFDLGLTGKGWYKLDRSNVAYNLVYIKPKLNCIFFKRKNRQGSDFFRSLFI